MDKKADKVTISAALLEKILVFFWSEIEDYTGAAVCDYPADSSIYQIFDGLCEEFDDIVFLEQHFPGRFADPDDYDKYLKTHQTNLAPKDK